MINNNRIQVSEFVGRGHPDKIADYLADSLLELANSDDPNCHMAVEVLTSNKYISVVGEYRSINECTSEDFIARIKHYLSKFYSGQGAKYFNIHVNIQKQSKLIHKTVLNGDIPDQGITFGYAENTNINYLPYSHYAAQLLNKELDLFISTSSFLGYDYKLMVETLDSYITKIVLSVQHDKNTEVDSVRRRMSEFILNRLDKFNLNLSNEYVIEVNPGGCFNIGGLLADSGATNRKLMVDNYGCNVEHGGGGYSGKDMSKPDRLFGYYARYIAKNVVASGLLGWCKIRLIFTYGKTNIDRIDVSGDKLTPEIYKKINQVFSKNYKEIYKVFNKFNKYTDLALFGHFGYCYMAPWEKLDKVNELLEETNLIAPIF